MVCFNTLMIMVMHQNLKIDYKNYINTFMNYYNNNIDYNKIKNYIFRSINFNISNKSN